MASNKSETPTPALVAESPSDDNSNPQQGTGGMPSEPSTPTKAFQSKDGYSRPSLMIPPNQKDERKLFVGGLPTNVTEEEFRSFFESFGTVLESIVLVDRVTSRSRGFGFVTFADVETSRLVLSSGMPDGTGMSTRLEMMGKLIEVKSAQPKESNRLRRGARRSATSQPHVAATPPPGVPPEVVTHQPYQQPYPAYATGYIAPPVYYRPEDVMYNPMMAEGYLYYPPPMMGFMPGTYPPTMQDGAGIM